MDHRKIGLGIRLSLSLMLTIAAVGNVVLLIIHGRNEWLLYVIAGVIALSAAQAWYQFVLARRRKGSGAGPA